MKDLREHDLLSKNEIALLEKCRRAVSNVAPDAQVVLYGSRARGEAGQESDYDLLVISKGEVNLEKEDLIRRELFPLELETGSVLTVILVSQHEWDSSRYKAMPFCQNVMREGVVL